MQAFADQGHTVVGVCEVRPSAALIEQAEAMQVCIYAQPGEWLCEADLVVSAVFGHGALAMFQAAQPYLKEACIYVDMTTAVPEAMEQANELAIAQGVAFVDVAITGAVNLGMRKTPLLLAGGKALEVQALYAPLGARVTVVGPQPGNAVRLKLLRSIFTKGLEALSVECLATAEAMGLSEELFNVLKDIDDAPLRQLMESMVQTHIAHSGRRAHEVEEAAQQMQLVGLKSVVLPGIHALFEKSHQAFEEQGFEGGSIEHATHWLRSHVLESNKAKFDH